jgi:hypothetical protein
LPEASRFDEGFSVFYSVRDAKAEKGSACSISSEPSQPHVEKVEAVGDRFRARVKLRHALYASLGQFSRDIAPIFFEGRGNTFMTTISASISSSSQVMASAQKQTADSSTQSTGDKTNSVNNSSSVLATSTSTGYSDASQAVMGYLLDQQDNAATSPASQNTSSVASSQKPAGGAPASGGGSSSSSTKTVTENEPNGEEIELTEDQSGKVISEKVIRAPSQANAPANLSAGKNATGTVQNS